MAATTCARKGPAFTPGTNTRFNPRPSDGHSCETYGPNWQLSPYGYCISYTLGDNFQTTEKSACCEPGSALPTANCKSDWCFGGATCDGQASVASYCSGTSSAPALKQLTPNGSWTFRQKQTNSDGTNWYKNIGNFTGVPGNCGWGGVSTPYRINAGDTSSSCIVYLSQAAAACNSSAKCTGFGVTDDGGWANMVGGAQSAQLWFNPPSSAPATSSPLRGDPSCTAIALRNPKMAWTDAAASAYCGKGDNIRTDPFCAQFCFNAGKPAWCDRAARKFCVNNPADADFCACLNSTIPSPTCLDGRCTARAGVGGAYTTAAQDAQATSCGSPVVCQQVMDFQAVNCPGDPSLKSCINIANNTFAQQCAGSPPPCRSDGNCPAGKQCVSGACVAPATAPIAPPAPPVPPIAPPAASPDAPAPPADGDNAARTRKIRIAFAALLVCAASVSVLAFMKKRRIENARRKAQTPV